MDQHDHRDQQQEESVSKRSSDSSSDYNTQKRHRASGEQHQTLSTHRQRYERNFPLYKQPVEVGFFSLDSKRNFFNDQRQLRYYVQPKKSPEFNLRDGYTNRFIKRDDGVKEKLDHILKWILENRDQIQIRDSQSSSSCPLGVDFVTWRGHLTKVLTTPYETQEGWMLAASRFGGTIYISEVETEAARVNRENRSERHEEMMYWGYKFEQYTCADDVDGAPDPGGVVNTNEAFCTVVQTRLADHKLLFSGEVDCRIKDSDAPPAPACYVELKTSAEICTPKQRSNFHRYKLLKWWAQSFLPGVPQIVAGFRDHDGIVVSVEAFQTSKISQLIKNEYNCWKPTVCMNFCNDFLSFVKSVVQEDDPRLVYLFRWDPHRDVTYTVHRDSQYTFIPEWYVQDTRSHHSSQH
ncbi:decapping and exoribonuclease protein [Myxocyprinus asiaticus]|uniref:decapping and exoribonuclease protein n=1 Tax=Myxocyprinus asiaticus TaxID=70543 RepID=UPI002222592F|nr:decapping and exoribonuclease protein [Myxocyprinus asiaticus]